MLRNQKSAFEGTFHGRLWGRAHVTAYVRVGGFGTLLPPAPGDQDMQAPPAPGNHNRQAPTGMIMLPTMDMLDSTFSCRASKAVGILFVSTAHPKLH